MSEIRIFLLIGLFLITLNAAKAHVYECYNPYDQEVKGRIKGLSGLDEDTITARCSTIPGCVSNKCIVAPKKKPSFF